MLRVFLAVIVCVALVTAYRRFQDRHLVSRDTSFVLKVGGLKYESHTMIELNTPDAQSER